jgi:hypothetical protein
MEVEEIKKNTFRIFGDSKEVDSITKNDIKTKYTLEDEIAILRKTLKALIDKDEIPAEFYEYNNFVEGVVDTNKEKKKTGE